MILLPQTPDISLIFDPIPTSYFVSSHRGFGVQFFDGFSSICLKAYFDADFGIG